MWCWLTPMKTTRRDRRPEPSEANDSPKATITTQTAMWWPLTLDLAGGGRTLVVRDVAALAARVHASDVAEKFDLSPAEAMVLLLRPYTFAPGPVRISTRLAAAANELGSSPWSVIAQALLVSEIKSLALTDENTEGR